MPVKGSYATAEQITEGIDLAGKVAIVTGASSGIGIETARVLALRNARVIMACRDLEKSEVVAAGIRKSTGNQDVAVQKLDLSDYASIREFVDEFKKRNLGLHLLINNAGVWSPSRLENNAGLELTMATNHLGHFLLTNLLRPVLVQSAPSRVVNVSSKLHKNRKMEFDDMFSKKSYGSMDVYGKSKLANIMFSGELNSRLASSNVMSVSLHPGIISTGLIRSVNPIFKALYGIFGRPWMKTVAQGAATTLFCATSSAVQGGLYYGDCEVHQTQSPDAKDKNLCRKLWEWSEEQVGEKFN
eukprot:ANDGO_03356.mRNA.1 Short-chain dehydrogenase TIC 32